MELLKLNELTKKKILFVAFATEKQQTCYIINTENTKASFSAVYAIATTVKLYFQKFLYNSTKT